jgi:protein TonB
MRRIAAGALFLSLGFAGAMGTAAGQHSGSAPRAAQHAVLVSARLSVADYPRSARRLAGGTTRLHVEVAPNGRVGQCSVVESSGSAILDSQSCRIVSRWRFRPARDAARRPVAQWQAVGFGWTPPDDIRLYPPVPVAH